MDLEDVIIPLLFGTTFQCLNKPTADRNRLEIEKTP